MANVFQEGEPLDVTALNDMYTRLTKLEGVFGSMTSAGSIVSNVLGPTVPVIDLGYIPPITVAAGAVQTYNMSTLLAKKFTGLGTPYLTATPMTDLNGKDSLSLTIDGAGLDKIINISNTSSRTLKVAVHWHAIFLKPYTI